MDTALAYPARVRATLPPPPPKGFSHVRSIKIQRPREEVYAFFRRLENLPRFMMHLKEVRELDNRRSHWVASGPSDHSVEWGCRYHNGETQRVSIMGITARLGCIGSRHGRFFSCNGKSRHRRPGCL